MALFRMYSGADGRTHIERISVDGMPELIDGMRATRIFFRKNAPGHFRDWHPAPRRQFVISLCGELEIGLGDGAKHRFGPGTARLVEDTTGKGHTTRVSGVDPCVLAIIPLE